jgi:hypothetical protein
VPLRAATPATSAGFYETAEEANAVDDERQNDGGYMHSPTRRVY